MKIQTLKRDFPLHIMLFVPVIFLIVYCYWPMVGILMAFEDFIPTKGFFGSRFVGLENFKYIFSMPDTLSIVWNTFFIAIMKIAIKIIIPLVFALLLNEVGKAWFKKLVQTITYFPYFLSWVVLGGILLDFFSPSDGLVNKFLNLLGKQSFYFFGDEKAFPFMVVLTEVWKNMGFNTIIFLAAITGIDPARYEAAIVDGAGRWKQTIYVTIPGIAGMIVLVSILAMGNILNAGFDQIFNLYSPLVYSTGDIIDTFVYRTALLDGQFNIGTAAGLFKSAISFVMITLSYTIANKYSNYRVF
ncbi:MAG: ABC transporter permease subunit [Clostridiaceae bacterium]